MRIEAITNSNNGLVVRLIRSEVRGSAAILFFAAVAATLAIGFREPRIEYVYETVVFLLAGYWCWRSGAAVPPMPVFMLALMMVWGFIQLAVGATVYRHATLEAALRFAALSATTLVSFRVFGSGQTRLEFLRIFAWFGAVVAVISVLASFTSPDKILWMFDAPYTDVWGPFLSRNNFAQFLELAMPVSLWLAMRQPAGDPLYISFAAIMLAAGMASASRAGVCVLVLEAVVGLWMWRESPRARRMALGLICATILFAAIPGVGHLAGRFSSADPFEGRREINRASIAMIASRPWTGFGLGTYPAVYPAYAVIDMGKSVEHAHNDWLEWTAEGGIPFVLAWIGLALWAVRPAMRAGWGMGVLGCFLHGAVDYPFARFGISAWIFLLFGMLAANELRELPHRRHYTT